MINKKLNQNKVKVAAIVTAGAMMMTACSVDFDRVNKAVSDLGEKLEDEFIEEDTTNQNDAPVDIVIEETQPVETEIVDEEPEETIPEETIQEEVIPDETQDDDEEPAAPTTMATTTPTPTPEPERVDFSELTTDVIAEGITVNVEEFDEHYSISADTRVADFSGNRMLISSENDIAAVTAINLYLDAFYSEAEGLYGRYTNESLADLTLMYGIVFDEYVDETIDEEDADTNPDEESDEDVDAEFSVDIDDVIDAIDSEEESEEVDETTPDEIEEVEEDVIDIDSIEIADEDVYHIVINYNYYKANRILTVQMNYSVLRGEEEVASAQEEICFDLYTGQMITMEMLFVDTDAVIGVINEEILGACENDRARVNDIQNLVFNLDTDDEDVVIVASATVRDEEIEVSIEIENYEEMLTRYGRVALLR